MKKEHATFAQPDTGIDEEMELVTEIAVSIEESEVLRKVLERDRTAAISHGGLRGLLSLSDDEARTLVGFLRKV